MYSLFSVIAIRWIPIYSEIEKKNLHHSFQFCTFRQCKKKTKFAIFFFLLCKYSFASSPVYFAIKSHFSQKLLNTLLLVRGGGATKSSFDFRRLSFNIIRAAAKAIFCRLRLLLLFFVVIAINLFCPLFSENWLLNNEIF